MVNPNSPVTVYRGMSHCLTNGSESLVALSKSIKLSVAPLSIMVCIFSSVFSWGVYACKIIRESWFLSVDIAWNEVACSVIGGGPSSPLLPPGPPRLNARFLLYSLLLGSLYLYIL